MKTILDQFFDVGMSFMGFFDVYFEAKVKPTGLTFTACNCCESTIITIL